MTKKEIITHFLIYTCTFLLIWPILEYLCSLITGNEFVYKLDNNIRTALCAGIFYSLINYFLEKENISHNKKRK